MDEFELIACLLEIAACDAPHLTIPPGDDAAGLRVPPDQSLLVTTDTLLAGRHFPEALAPATLAWRALMVNLSDLAAMGARPQWYLVALTAPDLDAGWIEGFAAGLRAAAPQDCVLAGGNLSRGPLSVTITAGGIAPERQVLKRSGARVGELLCVSGAIGVAGAGLRAVQADPGKWLDADLRERAHWPDAVRRYLLPQARVELGLLLRGQAGACIDISDGLLAELDHLARASDVLLRVDSQRIPVAEGVALEQAVASGDDFELLFTLPGAELEALVAAAAPLPLHVIGEVAQGSAQTLLLDADGDEQRLEARGYRHF